MANPIKMRLEIDLDGLLGRLKGEHNFVLVEALVSTSASNLSWSITQTEV